MIKYDNGVFEAKRTETEYLKRKEPKLNCY